MVFGRSEAVGRAGAAGATGDWAAGVTAERPVRARRWRSLCRSLAAESFGVMGIPSRWHCALSLAISPAGAMLPLSRAQGRLLVYGPRWCCPGLVQPRSWLSKSSLPRHP